MTTTTSVKTIRTIRSLRTDRTAKRELRTTSNPSRGFTLIEVLVVLAIIAMIMTLGLPAVQRITYQRINSTTRKFIGVIRTVRNDSILLSSIHRLVIDLDRRSWWVESQQRFQMLSAEPKPSKGADKSNGSDSNFVISEKYSKKPIELPSGVAFNGVLKEGEKIRKEGVAYVHFFPNGLNEQAFIYLAKEGDKEDAYALLIRPTSGKVEVFNQHVESFNQ